MNQPLLLETIALLKKHSLKPSHRFAQNYLIDQTVIERQIQCAQLTKADSVLEIGAGFGTLTRAIAKTAKKVFAIEADKKLIPILKEQLAGFSNVEIIQGDALKIKFPETEKIVSNLPYDISSAITFKILDTGFKLAVLTYQKEFADRMIAKPGTKEYGRLTIGVYYSAKAEILEILPPNVFYPRPKVYSAIVRLSPKSPPFEVVDKKFYFDLVRALFQHRRKKVKNALLDSFHEIAPEARLPRQIIKNLKPEEIAEISNKIFNNIKDILSEEYA